jgi:hypothetical protein
MDSERTTGRAFTDGAQPAVVLAQLLQNAAGWEPDARISGNIRACDIVHACSKALDALAARTPERTPEAEEPEASRTKSGHHWYAKFLEAQNEIKELKKRTPARTPEAEDNQSTDGPPSFVEQIKSR